MEETDARVSNARGKALKRLRARHPAFFPDVHVTPGLSALPVALDNPGRGGYWRIESAVEKIFDAPDFAASMWPDIPKDALKRYLGSLRQVTALTGIGGSHGMAVYKAVIHDADMITLADDRKGAVIKAQPFVVTGDTNKELGAFTNEVIVTRLLNALVTAFKYTATPHFTTFLGCFKSDIDVAKPTTKLATPRVHAVYERATRGSLLDLWEGPARVPVDEWASYTFQVLFTLAVSSHTLGYTHNDLHTGNVMLRDTEGTRYANAIWAYKVRGHETYIRLDPSTHHNSMVEIIDQGAATIAQYSPDDPRSDPDDAALRFGTDVRTFFNEMIYMGTTTSGGMEPPWMNEMRLVAERLPELRSVVAVTPEKREFARRFYTHWHTTHKEYGLWSLWRHLNLMPPTPNAPVVLVGLAPNDTLIAQDPERSGDTVGRGLSLVWNTRRGMKRTRSLGASSRCLVCEEEARYESKTDPLLAFCGRDCYNVHMGHFLT
jgi:hypothetical protein